MKQISIITIISLLNLSFLNAQTTFDWDTAPTDNGDNITETIGGITATFTGPSTETTLANIGGFGGSSGNIISTSSSQSTSTEVTFSFSESVDVTSILAFEGVSSNIDYTFTPTGGTNSPITESLTDGIASVTLNWTEVTSFTVTSTGAWYGFDDLIINDNTLLTNDCILKRTKVFPNPSSYFIKIDGLTTVENYEIYNTIGQKVRKGIIVKNKIIDIQNLTNGIYFLKFERGNTLKFKKE